MKEPSVEPVQLTERIVLSEGEDVEEETLYTVPAGKRLIVQFVSVSCAASTQFVVRTEVDVAGADVFVPLSRPNEVNALTGAEDVTLYAEAGQIVVARFRHNNSEFTGTRIADFTIVGRLVSAG